MLKQVQKLAFGAASTQAVDEVQDSDGHSGNLALSMRHLRAIRTAEIARILPCITPGARVLELGAGAGWQARILAEHGCEVIALNVPENNYHDVSVFGGVLYDGLHLPLSSNSVDVVYSSNVLEHIRSPRPLQAELHRVLKPGGTAIHVVPTGAWRFWTTAAFYVRKLRHPNLDLFPERHGETGTALSELYHFSTLRWCRFFHSTGWTIERVEMNRLFYTGYSLLGARLPLSYRRLVGYVLGSACAVYVLR